MKSMGITTGPVCEVLKTFTESGGKGSGWVTLTSRGETLERVLVAGTRCCRQRGGHGPEDLHVLHPIKDFGYFSEKRATQVNPSMLFEFNVFVDLLI